MAIATGTAIALGALASAGSAAAVANDQSKQAAGQEGQRVARQNKLDADRRRASTNRLSKRREADAQKTKVAGAAGKQNANTLLSLKGIDTRQPQASTFSSITDSVLQESAV